MSVPVESDEPSNAVRQSTFFNTIDRNSNEIEVLQKSGILQTAAILTGTVTNGDSTHAPTGDAVYDFGNGLLASSVTDGDTTHAPTGDAVFDYIEAKRVTATASLNFPSIAAGTVSVLTITVTGAATGDSVALGPPSGLESNLIAFGRVSAADTVTVRLYNPTGSAIDPAAATWRATVFK